jgi:hypothetical protein
VLSEVDEAYKREAAQSRGLGQSRVTDNRMATGVRTEGHHVTHWPELIGTGTEISTPSILTRQQKECTSRGSDIPVSRLPRPGRRTDALSADARRSRSHVSLWPL